jgi:hypothetical protein
MLQAEEGRGRERVSTHMSGAAIHRHTWGESMATLHEDDIDSGPPSPAMVKRLVEDLRVPLTYADHRAALPLSAHLRVTVLDILHGQSPQYGVRVKAVLHGAAERATQHLVLAPRRARAHQDHRWPAEPARAALLDRPILAYEIARWRSALPRTNPYQPIAAHDSREEVDLLTRRHPTHAEDDWFHHEGLDAAACLPVSRRLGRGVWRQNRALRTLERTMTCVCC